MELTVLVKSIYFGATKLEHRRNKLSVAERAPQASIHPAASMLRKADFASKATAILIIVWSVFCDVPSSRSTLARLLVGYGMPLNKVDYHWHNRQE